MQSIGLEIIKDCKKAKLKQMEFKLKDEQAGGFVECPQCHYIGKNKRFTGKIFEDKNGRSFKCFACGLWRKLNG